ncbi:PREDICTED: kelch-like protein 20, partial [Amphimedon queenslandica]|uniref:BTB domain-containing protein n=1 Tax=Amphimedon queenslandica TaxID=400682 RepID=A0AAN0ISL8_AMPQE
MDTSSSPTAPAILIPASPGEGAEEKDNDPSMTLLSTSPTPQGELALAGELGTTDKLIFEAKKHPSDTLRSMQELRDEEKLCDVTLLVQGVEIKAHKIVLAASSHYFRSMFAGDMIESRSSSVELKDVEPDAISLLVEYSYTSQLEITSNNVQSVMAAASIFDFPFVLEATAKFLATHLHPSNCLGMRAFGRTYGSEALVNAASRHFRNHFTDAIKSEEFLQLPPEVFSELLDSDEVNVRTEEDIFRSLELWLNYEPESRKDSLPKLLNHIRLPLLPLNFLKYRVESNPYIKRSLDCRDLIDEAKNYHLFPDDYSQIKGTQFHPRKSTVGVLFAIGGRGAVGEPFCSVECY